MQALCVETTLINIDKIDFWGRILQSLNTFLFGIPKFDVIVKN
jgi:hypothetical protein